MSVVSIRVAEPDDKQRVTTLAASLESWFTKEAIEMMNVDLEIQCAYVACLDNEVVGFITYYSNEGLAYIGWMGVSSVFQRRGIGTRLMDRLVEELRRIGAKKLRVMTLSDTVEYKPYELTRSFYTRYGFREHSRVWRGTESCPEELHLELVIPS